MKKMNSVLTVAFALAFINSNAQINQTPIHSNGNQIYTQKEKSQPATGSMFITEKYIPARLSNDNKIVLARYNAYSDFFEVNNPQTEQTKVLPKNSDITITFTGTNDSYKIVNYKTDKDESINGYLNIISENPKVSFYKRKSVILQPEFFPANSYQSYRPANYKKADDQFYVKFGDRQAVYFSDRRKDFADLIPAEKEKQVISYIKKNKISLDKEQDLIKLGAYLQNIL